MIMFLREGAGDAQQNLGDNMSKMSFGKFLNEISIHCPLDIFV